MKNEKILLLEDIESLGKKGEILNVRRNYALSFLIPKKKALKIKNNENYIIKTEKDKKLKKDTEYEKIKSFLDKVEEQGIQFELKEQNGKVFGSVKLLNIVKYLNKILKNGNFGFKVNEKNVLGFEKASSSGDYNIKIKIKKLVRDIVLRITLI